MDSNWLRSRCWILLLFDLWLIWLLRRMTLSGRIRILPIVNDLFGDGVSLSSVV